MSKKVTISSIDIYEHHNLSYFCSADIVDGKIVSLYEETGREGGGLWSQKFGSNGSLRECLDTLAKDFGDLFYKRVYEAAYAELLDPVSKVVYRRRRRDIELAKEKVACTKEEYEGALKELKNLQ